LDDSFRVRVGRAPGETVVPSHCSPADLAGKHKLLSSSWAADVGIANAISKPGFSQASSADQSLESVSQRGRPIDFPGSEHCPSNTRQFIGKCHTGNVVVGTRGESFQPRTQTGRLRFLELQDSACPLRRPLARLLFMVAVSVPENVPTFNQFPCRIRHLFVSTTNFEDACSSLI
jgi:hypothetical protein